MQQHAMSMKVPTLLKLFFICLPFLEIAVFILVGEAIGVLPTIGLIILGMVLGVVILRTQGMLAVWRMQQRLQQRADPEEIFNTMLIVFAGMLLIIPGFITDAIGLLCLLPFVRQPLVKWQLHKARQAMDEAQKAQHAQDSGKVIEGEYWHKDDKE